MIRVGQDSLATWVSFARQFTHRVVAKIPKNRESRLENFEAPGRAKSSRPVQRRKSVASSRSTTISRVSCFTAAQVAQNFPISVH